MTDDEFAAVLERLSPNRVIVPLAKWKAIRESTDPMEVLTWAFLKVVPDSYLPEHLMIFQGDRQTAIVNTETGNITIQEHESFADLLQPPATLPIPRKP